MALIKCRECGHMISDKATRCPKCTHLVFLSDKRNTSKSVCFSDDAAENQWVTVLNKHGATYMSMNLSYYP